MQPLNLEFTYRSDIQGLRALAVVLVVIYHIWPSALPGGYIGVDVFFVISGFLITGHLIRELEDNSRIDLARFYLRRARRLVPAAALVTLVVLVVTPTILPPYQWSAVVQQSFASLFYFQNWVLLANSVDYLNAEAEATPLQHFWSLSVEEQFYIFWPILLATASIFPRVGMRQYLILAILVVVGVSLGLSIEFTSQAGVGYFSTYTRLWELALGGLAAALSIRVGLALSKWQMSTVGILAILLSAILLNGNSYFPGYVAVIPVAATALVLLARSQNWLLTNRLSTKIGDISYSLYLWHWPVIVFAKAQYGADISFLLGCAILILSFSVSWLSKLYVEDLFREKRKSSASFKEFFFVATLMIPAVSVAGCLALYVFRAEAISINPQLYPGAAASTMKAPPHAVGFYPPLAAVPRDRADVYDNDCHLAFSEIDPKECIYGDPTGRFTVVLVGDSHAVNWLPALTTIALKRHWKILSFTKSSCPLLPIDVQHDDAPYGACAAWKERVVKKIRSAAPDLVVIGYMAQFATRGEAETRAFAQKMTTQWSGFLDPKTHIAVIRDTPEWRDDPNKCLARNDENCAVAVSSFKKSDIVADAVEKIKRASLIDLNAYVCPAGYCSPTVGNVVVWRDRHHLTATYSKSLSPFLEAELVKTAYPSITSATATPVAIGSEQLPLVGRTLDKSGGAIVQ